MELTINIKEDEKIPIFLNLIQEFEYVEIVDFKEDRFDIPSEHKELLKQRLKRIKDGKASFKSWDLIKGKYEAKEV